jgi:hypothetical protein
MILPVAAWIQCNDCGHSQLVIAGSAEVLSETVWPCLSCQAPLRAMTAVARPAAPPRPWQLTDVDKDFLRVNRISPE